MKKLLLLLLVFSVFASYAQVPSYVPTNGLIGYWPFNGNANDESGNGNNGTLNGGVTFQNDRFGNQSKSCNFNGDGFIEIPSLLNIQYNPTTYSAWIRASSLVTDIRPLGAGVSIVGRDLCGQGIQGQLVVWHNPNVSINQQLDFYTGGSGVAFNYSVPLNSWIHVVFSWNQNDTMKLYVNGQLIQSVYSSSSGFLSNGMPPFRIGSGAGNCTNNSIGRSFWKGDIDEVTIYNRALSQSEITSLYTSNSCIANITNNDTTICRAASVTLNAASNNQIQNVSSLTREWTNTYSNSNGIFSRAILFDSSLVISGSNWPSWPSGTTDQMITKIGTDGSLKWRNVRAPGGDHDGYRSVYRYPNGNLLFFGQENAQGTNYFDGFWTRFDANGNELNYGFFNVPGSSSGTDVIRLTNGNFAFSGPDPSSSTWVAITDSNLNQIRYVTYQSGGWFGSRLLCDSQYIYSVTTGSNVSTFTVAKYDLSLNQIAIFTLPNNGATTNTINDAKLIDSFIYLVGNKVVNGITYGVIYKLNKTGSITDSYIDSDQSDYTALVGKNGKIFFAKSYLNASGYSTLNKIIEFAGNGQIGIQYTMNNGSPFCPTDLNISNNYIYASGISGAVAIGIPAVEKIKINYSNSSTNPTYLWSTGATTPTITVSPLVTTTYYCTVSDGVNTCRDSVKITVGATAFPSAPATLTGATDVCSNFSSTTSATSNAVTYTAATVSTASSYTWTVPTGVTIVSDQGTNSITVTFASTFVTGAITVKSVNACGSSTAARSLTVYKRVAATPGTIQKEFTPTSIVAVTNVTGLVSETYRIKKVTYATSYNWSMNQGTSATITHINPSGVNDTAVIVTFANCFVRDTLSVKSVTPCSVSAVRTSILYAYSTPAAVLGITTVGGNFATCIGINKTFTALRGTPTTLQAPITSFRWTRPANTTIVSATSDSASITVSFNVGYTGGSIGAKAVSSCGTIGTTASTAILQFLPPGVLSIASSTGAYNACIGNSITYSALVSAPSTSQVAASLFRWTKPNFTTITSASADSSTITLQFNTGYIGGTLSVKGQTSCGTQGTAKTQALTHGGCAAGTKMSVPVTTTDAGLFEVSLYPNPSAGEFKLMISAPLNKSKAVVKVIDIQGRLMKSFECNANQVTALGNELKPGVYMVEVRMGNEVKTVRAVRF